MAPSGIASAPPEPPDGDVWIDCWSKGCYSSPCVQRGILCPAHWATKCNKEGCYRKRDVKDRYGFCRYHQTNKSRNKQYVQRLSRDARLRAKFLDKIMKKQHGRCANVLGRCPWTGEVPEDMVELDHIQPVCEGGSDSEFNLQVLCACCHAAKSRAERKTSE